MYNLPNNNWRFAYKNRTKTATQLLQFLTSHAVVERQQLYQSSVSSPPKSSQAKFIDDSKNCNGQFLVQNVWHNTLFHFLHLPIHFLLLGQQILNRSVRSFLSCKIITFGFSDPMRNLLYEYFLAKIDCCRASVLLWFARMNSMMEKLR